MIFDIEACGRVGHLGADDSRLASGNQAKEIEEVHAEVQGASAAGGRAMEHPIDARIAIALHGACDEFVRGVLDGFARRGLANHVQHRTQSHHEAWCGEDPALTRASRDIVNFSGGDAARLLHREGNPLLDQEARQLRHVAMASQREREIGTRRAAHLAIIHPRLATSALGSGLCNYRIGIADADDFHPRILECRFQIEHQVPMRHSDEYDTHTNCLQRPTASYRARRDIARRMTQCVRGMSTNQLSPVVWLCGWANFSAEAEPAWGSVTIAAARDKIARVGPQPAMKGRNG